MPVYYKGRVEPKNLAHLIALSHARHGHRLRHMKSLITPPPSWDSRTKGWVPPVQDQGQCHDEKTEVLTERGWKRWDEYDYITPIATMNRFSGSLEFQPPLSRHIYDYDGPLYFSDSNRLDFALTPDHRMYACDADKARGTKGNISALLSKLSFMSIKDVGWRVSLPGCTTGWMGTELNSVKIGKRDYTGDDFLALVALVLSDGYIRHPNSGDGAQNIIGFCAYRDDRQEMVRGLAHRLGIKEIQSSPCTWRFSDGGLAEWFRQNAFQDGGFTATYKHIPLLVKCASQRQIEHFLRFFGDQTISPEGHRGFFSSSELMIDDLQELLLRIGKRGSILKTPPRSSRMRDGREIHCKESYSLYEAEGKETLCIDRKTHLKTDYYKGKVYCATVPNGTIVTRRNKRVLISGNCGSCWAFSGTGVCDVAYMVAGMGGVGKTWLFSEQYTLSCGSNGGCNGDDNTNVLDWAKTKGLPTQEAYGPYDARAESCKWSSSMPLYKITDWGFADSNGGQGVTPAADIKARVMQYGGVGCAVAADDAFSNYSGGVFAKTTSQDIDHDVMIVGWDDTKSTVQGKTVWLMRNSWNTTWGEGGYMWILEGVNLIGTESVWAVVNNPNPQPQPLPPYV